MGHINTNSRLIRGNFTFKIRIMKCRKVFQRSKTTFRLSWYCHVLWDTLYYKNLPTKSRVRAYPGPSRFKLDLFSNFIAGRFSGFSNEFWNCWLGLENCWGRKNCCWGWNCCWGSICWYWNCCWGCWGMKKLGWYCCRPVGCNSCCCIVSSKPLQIEVVSTGCPKLSEGFQIVYFF